MSWDLFSWARKPKPNEADHGLMRDRELPGGMTELISGPAEQVQTLPASPSPKSRTQDGPAIEKPLVRRRQPPKREVFDELKVNPSITYSEVMEGVEKLKKVVVSKTETPIPCPACNLFGWTLTGTPENPTKQPCATCNETGRVSRP